MNLTNDTSLKGSRVEDCLVNYPPGLISVEILNCIVAVPASITTTLANLLVVISIWRTPSLHLPSNILLAGLALSDLGVGLVVYPILFAYNFARIKELPTVLCASSVTGHFIGYCIAGVSFLTLTAISLDRYMAIHLHLRYQEIVTVPRVTAVLIFFWLFCILLPISYIWSTNAFEYSCVIIGFLCFITIVFVYCKIYLVVRRHQAQIHSQLQAVQGAQQQGNTLNFTKFKNSFISTFVVMLLFFFCYFPFVTVMTLMAISGYTKSRQAALDFASLFACVNSTLNPFVYCWRYRPIRTAVIETVRHYWEKIRR